MSKKTLRWYQKEAVDEIVKSWKRGEVPYTNCCPGSGKSLMLAELSERCLKQGGRVIQLVPKLEHVNQNYREMFNHSDHKNDIGICCSKLQKFQTSRKCVIATASSFLRRRATSGAFNVCLIDEVHNVPNDLDSGYRKIITSLLRQNPRMLIAGVSGTPYRMSQGMMHESCIKGPALFTHQVYETPIPKMIEEGFLCHIESISGDVEIDVTGLKMSGQDYDTSAMAVKFEQICEDAVKDTKLKIDLYDIQTGIIFVSNVSNAEHVKKLWGNDEIRVLHGGVTDSERKSIIKWLETGSGRRFVVNPNILTEGYDFPQLDLVVLMRATASLRLYVQMTTRAIRAHSDKIRGYILDFGQNISRHGPIDATIPPKGKKKKGDAPSKPCTIILDKTIIDKDDGSKHLKGTQCFKSNLLSAKFCKLCGAEFIPENEEGKYSMRSKADILQMKIDSETFVYDVAKVYYEVAYSRKDQNPMIKVRFYDEDINHIHDHYLCLSHRGFARDNSIKMLISMLKNPSDYSDIAQFEGGVNVDNVLLLLDNDDYREQYFKKIKSITLAPQVGGRFKELKSIGYG